MTIDSAFAVAAEGGRWARSSKQSLICREKLYERVGMSGLAVGVSILAHVSCRESKLM